MAWEALLLVVVAAFILQYLDASAGMGFGSISAFLIIIGFDPIQAVSAVITTSAALSIAAGFFHDLDGNIKLDRGERDFKIFVRLALMGSIGVILGVFTAELAPQIFLKIYIGLLVTAIGLAVLIRKAKKKKFSWARLYAFSAIASFNKGMTGGGFGPVLAGGQILAGVNSKRAVGMTAAVEGMISLLAAAIFVVTAPARMDLALIGALLLGGLLATPVATYSVKKLPPIVLQKAVGIVSITLGITALTKIYFF